MKCSKVGSGDDCTTQILKTTELYNLNENHLVGDIKHFFLETWFILQWSCKNPPSFLNEIICKMLQLLFF